MFLIVEFFKFLSESIDGSQNFDPENKTQKFYFVCLKMDLIPFFVHFFKNSSLIASLLLLSRIVSNEFCNFCIKPNFLKLNARKSVPFNV